VVYLGKSLVTRRFPSRRDNQATGKRKKRVFVLKGCSCTRSGIDLHWERILHSNGSVCGERCFGDTSGRGNMLLLCKLLMKGGNALRNERCCRG